MKMLKQTAKEPHCVNNLEDLTKQELIEKIRSLQSHNMQLKNIIAKSYKEQTQKEVRNRQKPFDFTTCNYRHILLKFMYLGWDYQGYVVQENTTHTIEHHLFEALTKTCLIKDRQSSNYHRCGRTDKGVSSFSQVISIDLRSRLSCEKLEGGNSVKGEIDYCSVLNSVLPDTIRCIAWYPSEVNNFSARFDCKSRTYKYFFPKGQLDIERMECASKYLVGTHDFRNFCKMDVGNGVVKFVRSILDISIAPCQEHEKSDGLYSMYNVTITGQGFLWHQVRCIMGVLFLIGQGKEEPSIIKDLLDINENPRKPDYNMANETPLNLYHCSYDLDDSKWIYNEMSINKVMKNLRDKWTFSAIKTTMLKSMLADLERIPKHNSSSGTEVFPVDFLLNGIKSKKYIPLMRRQKCESLEDRIEHYAKRQKLEVS